MYQCVASGYFHEYKRYGYFMHSCTFKRHCYHLCNVSFISIRNRKVVYYQFSTAVNYRKCIRFYIAIWRSIGRKICEYCIYSDNYMDYMDLFSVAWKKNRQRCISSAGKNEFCCSLQQLFAIEAMISYFTFMIIEVILAEKEMIG